MKSPCIWLFADVRVILFGALAINTAWARPRYQPQSALAQWYRRKFGHGNSRLRKVGIVALGCKLLIAFWRYLETGVPPEGAVRKA